MIYTQTLIYNSFSLHNDISLDVRSHVKYSCSRDFKTMALKGDGIFFLQDKGLLNLTNITLVRFYLLSFAVSYHK